MSEKYEEFLKLCDEHGSKSQFMMSYMIKNCEYLPQSAKIYFEEQKKRIQKEEAEKRKQEKKENHILKYMITFTIDPKRHPDQHDTKFQDLAEKYIIKRLSSKCERIYLVKEHANDNVHWHVIVYCKKYFDQKWLQYYIDKYGIAKSIRSHNLSDEDSYNYLSKEGDIKVIKGANLEIAK